MQKVVWCDRSMMCRPSSAAAKMDCTDLELKAKFINSTTCRTCLFNPFYFRSIFGVQTGQPYQMGQGVDEHNRLSLTWRPGNLCEETISEQTSLLRSNDDPFINLFGVFFANHSMSTFMDYIATIYCCNTRFGLKDHAYLTYHISSKQLLPKARLMVFDIPSWSHHRAQFFGFRWTLGPMGCARFGEGGVGQARASDHRAVVRFAEGTGSAPSYIG